ncbi:MAG: cobalamin biosynthesis protein [Chloroflexota bacterium]|nr:cobalamin biosynthesis protein [Chloroflexota bacterium]
MQSNHKITLILALGIDQLLGDPPNRFHPVAWMGNLIAGLRRHTPRRGHGNRFFYGAFLTLSGAGLVAGIGIILNKFFARLPNPLGWLAEAVLLKSTFSLRGLDRAAGEVQTALEGDNLNEARRAVSWHLVSRDTSKLNASQVAAATIESVAENASDGIIAPLFYYALGGLPAALAYRFANTADSMLGYRDAAREWLGKFPARLDDLLNFIPARLTGLLFVLVAPFQGGSPAQTWQIMRRDANITDSPNAGYPMSAMAGALGIELEKADQYKLGMGSPAPKPEHIRKARTLLAAVTGLTALLFILIPHRHNKLKS